MLELCGGGWPFRTNGWSRAGISNMLGLLDPTKRVWLNTICSSVFGSAKIEEVEEIEPLYILVLVEPVGLDDTRGAGRYGAEFPLARVRPPLTFATESCRSFRLV